MRQLNRICRGIPSVYILILLSILGITPQTSLAQLAPLSPNAYSNLSHLQYKGIAFSGYSLNAFDNAFLEPLLDHYCSLGFNALELTPSWYQEDLNSQEIKENDDRTVKKADLERLIDLARSSSRNMKINIKPHVEPFGNGMPVIEHGRFEEMLKQLRSISPEQSDLVSECYKTVTIGDNLRVRRVFKSPEEIPAWKRKRCRDIVAKYPSNEYWRARLNPKDKKKWFESYTAFLLHYLEIAVKKKVELFTVGTELISMTTPTTENVDEWQKLMQELRMKAKDWAKQYHGKVPTFLYAAHEIEIFGTPHYFHDSKSQARRDLCEFEIGNPWQIDGFEKVCRYWIADEKAPRSDKEILKKFWELFDVISMTVYFELGNQLAVQIEKDARLLKNEACSGDSNKFLSKAKEQVDHLETWLNELKALGISKPIIIGELGYRSVDYCHLKPYQSSGAILGHNQSNSECQQRAYQAMLEALKDKEWLQGIFFWQEEIKNPLPIFRPNNTEYSLTGKPASQVVEQVFTGNLNPPLRSPPRFTWEFSRAELYDLMVGSGWDRGETNSDKWYSWGKIRARPLNIGLPFQSSYLLELGLWYSASFGGGELPVYQSSYEWERHLFGPTAKLIGSSYSLDLDMGIGSFHENAKNQFNSYRSQQDDDIFYLFAHLDINRRSKEMLLFPCTTMDIELTVPYKTDQRRTFDGIELPDAPYNRKRTEFTFTQGLIDIPFHWWPELRLTPNMVFKFGSESDRGYFTDFGAGVALGWNKRSDCGDIMTFSVLHEVGVDENAIKVVVFVDILKFFR